jgi:RimJ/RimL family protein N-acetyltransferase
MMISHVQIRSREGLALMVRPVFPEDGALIEEGFEHLSERSRYQRFLAPITSLSRGQLSYLSEVDHHRHVALGVLHGGEPVGVVRMVGLPDAETEADIAFTLVDDYQGQGIGSELLRVMAVVARHRGITRLHFDVAAENIPMLKLLGRFSELERDETGSVVHAVIDPAGIPLPTPPEGSIEAMVDEAALQVAAATSRSTNTP